MKNYKELCNKIGKVLPVNLLLRTVKVSLQLENNLELEISCPVLHFCMLP